MPHGLSQACNSIPRLCASSIANVKGSQYGSGALPSLVKYFDQGW